MRKAVELDRVRTVGIPVAFMFVLFLVVVMTTPQLMNSVLEEKMSRISEVLLGSVHPFELMLGKLLASTAVSAVMTMVYLTGGGWAANRWGYLDVLDPLMIVWFVVFLLLSVLMYGSFFIAIGAACSDLQGRAKSDGPGDDAPDGAGADVDSRRPRPAKRLCRRRLALSARHAVPDAPASRPPRTSALVAGHPRHAAHARCHHGRRLGRRVESCERDC